jgi:hypothetical protein
VKEYCDGALEFLEHAYDPDRALFSYSTRVDAEGAPSNDFAHPQTMRYTINTLLGLVAARAQGITAAWLGDVDRAALEFVEQHYDALESEADLGLLLVLLARVEPEHPAVARAIGTVEQAIGRGDAARRFDMQDLAWMLWGAVATERDMRSEALAHRIFALIRDKFVHPASGLPRHRTAAYRRNIVSFGSLVYYLRSTFEYAERFDDVRARAMFVRGVERALAIQGPDGEWPWMLDVRTAVPFDLYPVFTVHQDSMAMLFLFPAAQLGLPGVEEAIARSLAWNHGRNELSTSLVRTEPFFRVYRSIERDEEHTRLRRYLRGIGPAARGYPARSRRIRVNDESRSYHFGWVLFAWSTRLGAEVA